MRDIELLLKGYCLTTAEIVYHLPDFPELLQSFIWQDYDLPPDFPRLVHFLTFWQQHIEGQVHSVHFSCSDPLVHPKITLPGFSGVIR